MHPHTAVGYIVVCDLWNGAERKCSQQKNLLRSSNWRNALLQLAVLTVSTAEQMNQFLSFTNYMYCVSDAQFCTDNALECHAIAISFEFFGFSNLMPMKWNKIKMQPQHLKNFMWWTNHTPIIRPNPPICIYLSMLTLSSLVLYFANQNK